MLLIVSPIHHFMAPIIPTDRGSDEPLAEGNENGDILENSFHRNTVYSRRSDALKIT